LATTWLDFKRKPAEASMKHIVFRNEANQKEHSLNPVFALIYWTQGASVCFQPALERP
jgi:hypothetical protein